MRKPIMIANWKMHMTLSPARDFLAQFLEQELPPGVDVVICPPFSLLHPLAVILEGTSFSLGAQNMHWEEKGAFTGEISPLMLRDLGVDYVILGHSERRTIFGEKDTSITKKIISALRHDLIPIFCVGETLEERKQDKTAQVIRRQLEEGLKLVPRDREAEKIIIAYEPVWAIGTGLAATAEDAQKVVLLIREVYGELFGERASLLLRVQYGGSVKEGNIKEFMSVREIDGALVGGSSLDSLSWMHLIQKGVSA